MPANTLSHADWSAKYLQFAAVECPDEPVYGAICRAIAADSELLALHDEIPPEQARPNLLLAALHDALLADPTLPLARYYPNLGGAQAPDAELPLHLRALALGPLRARIRQQLRSRATQTNEAGRCGPLRLALDALGAHHTELALFEFGASAGLNLGVDEDAVDYGSFRREPLSAGHRLNLHCDWRGGTPPAPSPWRLRARAGMDLAPIDAHDPDALRWLQACLWPHKRARHERLRQALDWAQTRGPRIQQHPDGLLALDDWRAELPPGVQPVLLTCWVLAYLQPEDRARFHQRALERVRAQGLWWICAESPGAQPLAAPTAPESAATLWSLHGPDGSQALLWSHAHGEWACAA
ncbi:hypothetical protein HNQ51_002919 [Inhella inkyongensis]|uniref:DUF2332 domain-containing protein n=1 Tax=Inhella inkyongensis TaxID=392593 RepID=A0A840S7K6_9BURK|nr:DUF2332 domain-containing protein [Inhella inkyongensis]MBB5205592.1 hypothetical protein [Inhella inkyongensis]